MPKKTKDFYADILKELREVVKQLADIKKRIREVRAKAGTARDDVDIKKIKKQIEGLLIETIPAYVGDPSTRFAHSG